MEKQQLSFGTLIVWMIVVRLSDVFNFFGEFDTPAEHAAWIAVLIATVWVALATAVVYGLYRTFPPGRSLSEALELYLGPVAGKVLNAVLAWFFLQESAVGIRSLTDAIATVILPRTPPVVVASLMVWVVAVAVRSGIEVVGRTVIPLAIGMFGATGLITILIAGEIDFTRLQPVFGVGWKPMLSASVYVASFSIHLLLLLMFLGYTDPPRRAGWLLQAQNVFVHGFIAYAFVLTVVTMSYFITRNKVFEFLSVVRFISVGEFIERIDPLLLAGWVGTAYATVAAYFLATLMATRTLLGLKDYRAISWPMGVILIALARLLFSNVRERVAFMYFGGAVVPYHLFFLFVLPLVLLPIFYFRRRALAGSNPRGS